MHRISGIVSIVVCLWLALDVTSSWAQRPPGNDVSEPVTGNTGGGTGALSSTIGASNTAYGNAALHSNANGTQNTAFGDSALTSNIQG